MEPSHDPPARIAARTTRRPRRLLLVEDDEALRHYLAGELRRDGFEVMVATSAAEVFDLILLITELGAEVMRPDVIVTDLRLPDASGFQVLRQLRGSAGWSMPIIAMSAFVRDADRDRARALGADDVFRKPFELDDLRTALRVRLDHPAPGRPGAP